MIHTDCFAYVNKNGIEGCKCLNELYCEKEDCRFYKSNVDLTKVERDIRNYTNYTK